MRPLSRRFLFIAILTGLVTQTLVARAHEREPFSVVVLPDTQYYAQKYTDTYEAQTRWIKDQAAAQNIRFVIHEGDLVNRVAVLRQWEVADRAHRVLDGVVPYSVLPGNHDMRTDPQDPSVHDTKIYNDYFGPARFKDRPWYGGNEDGTNDNNYCFFDGAGMKFLVVNLEFDPSDTTLAWAGKIIDAHPDRRVILATHGYLGREGRREPGERIWKQVVRTRPSVFLVLCGHIPGVQRFRPRNAAGQRVSELLADYQRDPNGGDGWLRILRFVPDKNRIEVRTYSPTLKQNKHSSKEEFSLRYDMSPVSSDWRVQGTREKRGHP